MNFKIPRGVICSRDRKKNNDQELAVLIRRIDKSFHEAPVLEDSWALHTSIRTCFKWIKSIKDYRGMGALERLCIRTW